MLLTGGIWCKINFLVHFFFQTPACVPGMTLVFGAALPRPLLGGIRRDDGVASPLGLSRSVHRKIFGPIAKIRSTNHQISRPESATRPATAQNFKQGTCPHGATAKTGLAMCFDKLDFDWDRFAQNAPNVPARKSKNSISSVETRFSPVHHLAHGRA